EAHETVAIAMNRLGGKSNSGEGGEDPMRYQVMKNGDFKRSSIKQVASGRFGVTSHYLVNADELQIKISQGAKPGEGGQLPGFKVDEYIGMIRHTIPGVTLISPPPHHDIYSIEDLAQLIFDLKNSNPKAEINVKLVAETGVGTVAAGVSKAKANIVTIAGHDGGTGASPATSIKHAGLPWEIGLAETQQTLVVNNLRGQIKVQVDGQIKTGRDVVIGALLGAEEFGFATSVLIVLGCVMMRKCHLNTCPVGVATQDEELRQNFKGRADYLVNYFHFIAQEVREYMAELGFSKFEDMIGQVQFLKTKEGIDHWKAKGLDFSRLFVKQQSRENAYRNISAPNHQLEQVLDQELILRSKPALEDGKKVEFSIAIKNKDRTAGTMLGSEISKRFGENGLDDDTIKINLHGTAGQSFGAFIPKGMTLNLSGDANDYVGKGLSGGNIIIHPPPEAKWKSSTNMIIGNTVLYGATSGQAYFCGLAGERFAVRNSGAIAVVEGVGDHGCEYMTGGVVAVLGETGANFAAGMSGGIAFVYDRHKNFKKLCNLSMVDIEKVNFEADIKLLFSLIKDHYQYTNSQKAKFLLENWKKALKDFVLVIPLEYRKVLAHRFGATKN
ncbi:MAG: glutamate synthase-related protein, partial [Deltaproteobacteria bacterium]|nr:glutamate synthase-related protein [Deltaproteobacteria bacterium]